MKNSNRLSEQPSLGLDCGGNAKAKSHVVGAFTLILAMSALCGCASSSAIHPQYETIDQVSNLLRNRGVMEYQVQTFSSAGNPTESSSARGLLTIRDRKNLTAVGGAFFDDGFGNLVRQGNFSSRPFGGLSAYSYTFLRGGGQQVALDFRRDGVVDAVIDWLPDGGLGIISDPELGSFIDCIRTAANAGATLVDAVNVCLGNTGDESSGGIGSSLVSDVARLAEADCSNTSPTDGGVPSSVAQGPTARYPTLRDETYTREGGGTVTVREHEVGDAVVTEVVVADSEGRVTDYTISDSNSMTHLTDGRPAGSSTYTRSERTTYNDDGSSTTHVEEWVHDGEKWIKTKDYVAEQGAVEIGAASSSGTTGQPGPECGNEEPCPVIDPRCAEPQNDIESLWDCQAQTDFSLSQCVARIRDEILVITGGQCQTNPGPGDGPVIQCFDSSISECLAAGGAIRECMEHGPDPEEPPTGPEGDDLFDRRFPGRQGYSIDYIETIPAGAIFFTLCNEGVEQLCRSPGVF